MRGRARGFERQAKVLNTSMKKSESTSFPSVRAGGLQFSFRVLSPSNSGNSYEQQPHLSNLPAKSLLRLPGSENRHCSPRRKLYSIAVKHLEILWRILAPQELLLLAIADLHACNMEWVYTQG